MYKLWHAIVKGNVQGVGYRYFVHKVSIMFDITGWVCNLDDGSVEIYAELYEDTLNEFVDKIRRGNGYSEIRDISIVEENSLTKRSFNSFFIKY